VARAIRQKPPSERRTRFRRPRTVFPARRDRSHLIAINNSIGGEAGQPAGRMGDPAAYHEYLTVTAGGGGPMFVQAYFRGNPKRCPDCGARNIRLCSESAEDNSAPALLACWRCEACGVVFQPPARAVHAAVVLALGLFALALGAASTREALESANPLWERCVDVLFAGGTLAGGAHLVGTAVRMWRLRGQVTIVDAGEAREPDA